MMKIIDIFFLTLLLVLGGCKSKESPLDRLFPKTEAEAPEKNSLGQDSFVQDLPRRIDFENKISENKLNNMSLNNINLSNMSLINKPKAPLASFTLGPKLASEIQAKDEVELVAPAVPMPDTMSGALMNGPLLPLAPPPPPPPPSSLPPEAIANGFREFNGPIYSLCGNGKLDKVINSITCPILNPTPIDDINAPCVGFAYIEQCDDGNTFSNDGCSSTCMKECCGNGIVEEGEQCDLGSDMGNNAGLVLPNISPPNNFPITRARNPPDGDWNQIFADPPAACADPLSVKDTLNCSRNCQLIVCGDGVVNGLEECDDGNELGCDGCFKCTLERPNNACPCNCTREPKACCDDKASNSL